MNHLLLPTILELRDARQAKRREFLRSAGIAGVALTGASLLASCNDGEGSGTLTNPTPAPTPTPAPAPTPTPTPLTDADVLNFALNLEYLEASFYLYATSGSGLPAGSMTGTGTQGSANGGRAVTFTDPVVAQYAREIAADELAHVNFLRTQLGSAAIAMPQIDISASSTGAFSAAARSAGLITGSGSAFDPYADDQSFLLAAFIFEDVGVTAYKGAAPLLTSKTYLEAAAGILAAEAYHAGLIRSVLYRKGIDSPSARTSADKISDARDSLDGSSDKDQGISPDNGVANIVPTDADGIAFSRSTGEVLKIAYLNSGTVSQGGFFPAGVNGTIKASAAS